MFKFEGFFGRHRVEAVASNNSHGRETLIWIKARSGEIDNHQAVPEKRDSRTRNRGVIISGMPGMRSHARHTRISKGSGHGRRKQ
ncbi:MULTISPECIES: hypothetical protein [Rhizobium]|uniref:hypothetical protein n=1 Tax=Rhizobium TaxID=379 RepID=UPI000F788DCA|nr:MULTISPECIES: hypothetical protein [Rhizobium]MBA9036641.1 hypothetical protein [Rhizobium leguminosarum]TBF86275.1 hypothetical protein ELG85_36295 [Rhizobium leguminosarum]TBG09589.1 hypothetical protein ELG79_35990 [Rhizobium leguminosarum]TBG28734.1 hypothetical protein ELG78_36390 [Rhizobium leguminosarum]TBG52507.1 hypothetical protein ELG74_36905 [Rhizobium leguminosarum]